MAHWHAIAVYTGAEFRAVEEMIAAGCREVTCPTFREVRRRADKNRTRHMVDEALLPGYIFASVPDSAWDGVYSAKSVVGVVSSPEGPTPITGRALVALKAFLRRADNGEFDMAGADERVQPGDILRVLFGPWEGHTVQVVKKHPHRIECASDVELFGRRAKIEVGYDEAQPVVSRCL